MRDTDGFLGDPALAAISRVHPGVDRQERRGAFFASSRLPRVHTGIHACSGRDHDDAPGKETAEQSPELEILCAEEERRAEDASTMAVVLGFVIAFGLGYFCALLGIA